MSIQPRDVTPEISRALAAMRIFANDASRNSLNQVSREAADAINALDNAGVFAEIDERNDYASAEEILAESAARSVEEELGSLDPAEWGDTTRWDQVVRQICTCGLQGETSPALHVSTCPVWTRHHNLSTATRVPRHGHAFTGTEGSGEMCIASPNCTVTYGEYVLHQN